MGVTLLLLVLSAGNQSVHDRIEGAEIGDREQAMTFASDGRYRAERRDAAGQSQARGIWKLNGGKLTVTVSSCKGPHCKTFGTSFTADLEVVGDRALTVDPTPREVPLARGSYYCHHQGCEKRIGIQLASHAAPSPAVRQVEERLIERNVSRNTSVIWWAPRSDTPAEASTVVFCTRDPEPARKSADLVLGDLDGLLGPLVVTPGNSDCLWDVLVTVGDRATGPEPASRQPP